MRTIIAIIGIATLCLGLIGCSEEPTPTAVQEDPGNVAVKAPGNGQGAVVIRYEGGLALTYVDVNRGLRVVFGLDMNEYCVGIYDFDLVNIMEITNPADQYVVNQLINGDGVRASVYPLFPFDCEIFLATEPLATGYVKLVSTDNDLYAYFEENLHPRVNSYKTTATGELYTPDGDKVMLAYVNKIVWPGYPDFDQIRELVSDVHLAFTGAP